jgi:hypothetical protein
MVQYLQLGKMMDASAKELCGTAPGRGYCRHELECCKARSGSKMSREKAR